VTWLFLDSIRPYVDQSAFENKSRAHIAARSKVHAANGRPDHVACFFFRRNISVICLTVGLKLAIAVFLAYIFETF